MKRFLLVLGLAAAGAGASPTPAPVSPDELVIKAGATEFDGVGHSYKVSGDVRLELRDLKVACKEARIFLAPDDGQVVRIVFSGEVVATRGRSAFRGDRVTYHVATRKLVAEGNTRTRLVLPVARQAGAK